MPKCDFCKKDVPRRTSTYGCGTFNTLIKLCPMCKETHNFCIMDEDELIRYLKKHNAQHLISSIKI